MKRYIALLLGLGVLGFLIFGCDTIVEPEQTVLETGQAETVTDGDFGKKMLPYRGGGTWQAVEFLEPDFEEMEIGIVVASEGTATHLGRHQAVYTMIHKFVMIGDDLVPTDYVSHSAIYTAANGDELHDEGSADNGTEHFVHDDGIGFFMTGIRIVGGTGRFENAVGSYDILVTATVGFPFPAGTWELEGEISFGKMKPLRGGGTYEYVDFAPDFDEMEIEIVVALEGRATRLGRFQGIETYRFEFEIMEGAPVPTEYLSHSSTYTAANGDELHIEGCVVEHGSGHEWYDDGTGFSLTGVHIVGGTGRFENAVGWYDFWVTRTSDLGGTWEFEGGISN